MRHVIVIIAVTLLISHSAKPAAREMVASYIAPALSSDTPAIGLAAYKGDISTLRRCIAAGISVEASGEQRRTPLLLASAGGHIDAVETLLKAGARIDAQDHGGATALHWAAHRGETKIALFLIGHNAAVNIQDEFRETPLILAAMVGDKTIVKALLRAGADRKLKDVDGWTASGIAEQNNYRDIANLLR